MENNNKTKWIWTAVVIVVIIGLVLIANKENKLETSTAENTELAEENPATTTTGVVSPTTRTATQATASVRKPVTNVVELTNKGFSPFMLQIKRGESVEFLNSSDKAMIIRSYDNKPENVYPGFSQESGPLGKGGRFYFAFTTAGDWAYYNLNSKEDVGVISVR